MSSTRSLVLGVAAIGTALAVPVATADTVAPLYQKVNQRFTVAKAGQRTGWSFSSQLKPIAEGQAPPLQRQAVFVFPAGTKIDGTAVPACKAKPDKVLISGASACPRGARVGSGQATALIAGTSLATKLEVYAAGKKMLLRLVTADSSRAPLTMFTGVIKGNRVSANTRVNVSGIEPVITSFDLSLNKAGTARRPLLRTPKTCPTSKQWTFRFQPTFDPPYGAQPSTTSVACRR